MIAEDVLSVLRLLEETGIEVYVDGGWGVDALLGEQTRDHGDLDIAIPHRYTPMLRQLLSKNGYQEVLRDDSWECNYVLGDGEGRLVDVHTYIFDEDGKNVYGVAYEPHHLTGAGTIGGYAVKCIPPDIMVAFHTGYEVDENDYRDVKALCDRFAIPLPKDYDRFLSASSPPKSKWVRQIVDLQHDDGSWGHLHSLAKPTTLQSMTTEQALRRLHVLGFTKDDEPIAKALSYLRSCLQGELTPPDRREKVLNWDRFIEHLLATWIRLFVPDDALSLPVAEMWAEMITVACRQGYYDEGVYKAIYREQIPMLHKGEREISVQSFYMVNLLQGVLDQATESIYVDFLIHSPEGIGYIYNSSIANPPTPDTNPHSVSLYIAALEQLCGYSCASEKLSFAVDWLYRMRDEYGQWDLGAAARDGVYLPLSDSWRTAEMRKQDCTMRVSKLLSTLSATGDRP